jgi:hypothetical protein
MHSADVKPERDRIGSKQQRARFWRALRPKFDMAKPRAFSSKVESTLREENASF